MAKLDRFRQKVFALANALPINQEVSQIGSLANSAPLFSDDLDVIQALSQYDDGLFEIVIGGNSPAIEDINALFYLITYQLAYVFQAGIGEWNDATPYYIGSIVQDGTGSQYISLLDNNVNNDPTAGGDGWFPYGSNGNVANVTVGTGTLIANKRMYSPSPITLGAAEVLSCPATTIARVVGNITVPAGASLVVAPGGSVGVI